MLFFTRLLAASNISREMQQQNPQAVLDVLNYYEHQHGFASGGGYRKQDKFMTQSPPSTDPSPRPSYSAASSASLSPLSGLPPEPPGRGQQQQQQQQQFVQQQYPQKRTPSPPPTSATSPPVPPVRRAGSSASASSSAAAATTPTETHPPPPSLPQKKQHKQKPEPPPHQQQQQKQQQQQPQDEDEPPPPPIATRPEKTKSIYTKPLDEEEQENNGVAGDALRMPPNLAKESSELVTPRNANERPKKKKMSDEEILERLKTIVSVGDPNRK